MLEGFEFTDRSRDGLVVTSDLGERSPSYADIHWKTGSESSKPM